MTPRGRLPRTPLTALLVTVLAFGGCLSATPGRTPSANELQHLQATVDALNQRQAKGLEQQEAITKRLERLELERATAARETQELVGRLGTLTTELGALARETERLATRVDETATATAGRMDVVNSELQALGERLTTMARHLQELTTRLAATSPVEQAPPAASAVTPAPEAGALAAAPSASAPEAEAPAAAPSAPAREAEAPAAAPAPVPTPAPAPTQSGEPTPAPDSRLATAVEPQRLYNSGYTDYGRGNYALAIGAFREFIRRYPTDEMAGNAQYWIAEAYLGLAHRYANGGETERAAAAFDQAIEAFQAVGQRYPRSDKAPAALFREAGCHLEVGQADRARERLEYLVEHFPTAPEARLARQRLADGAKP